MRPSEKETLVVLRDITKSFPGVLANDHVNLDIYGGEVLALLGENGAGKSTLMKILYGFYRADAGEIFLKGQRVQIRSPHDARRLRIGMVFQNFVLIPALTVVENIALFLPDLPAVLDKARIAKRIEDIAKRYGLDVDPWAPLWQLSVGEQQKVEVLKLMLADAQILILDEPTKVLAPHEIEGLFRVFTTLRRDGYAVVFITHKLHEVMACADRITVMRQGKIAGSLLPTQATKDDLVSLMFGATPAEAKHPRTTMPNENIQPLIELKKIDTQVNGGSVTLKDINLTIMPGEIVGVAGVSGNGQKELGDVILGLVRISRGSKFLSGVDATRWSVAQVRASGVAFIPEDPLLMASVPSMSVQENMALGDVAKYIRHHGFSIDWKSVRADIDQAFTSLGLKSPAFDVASNTLSGGNLQRTILARELSRHPKLIIAFYPTRGMDVPSATAARDRLVAARDSGAGVLLISEDLEELFSFSDRLIVLYRGQIVGSFKPQETTLEGVGHLMTGSRGEDGQD